MQYEMPSAGGDTIDRLLAIDSRDVRVLSMDETSKAGGGLIMLCTILSWSSELTPDSGYWYTQSTVICMA